MTPREAMDKLFQAGRYLGHQMMEGEISIKHFNQTHRIIADTMERLGVEACGPEFLRVKRELQK